MNIQRLAAFTCGGEGGNPAGVMICDALPTVTDMQRIAAEIGYSETVFAAPTANGYRVRYFAPQTEVQFCGHATIALGAVLASNGENGPTNLELNIGMVTVEGFSSSDGLGAAFRSAPTRHQPAPKELIDHSTALFGWLRSNLDDRIPPAIIEAGARHLLLAVREREVLAKMNYDMQVGRTLMHNWKLTTISLINAESATRYHARNPFAAGGVYEDPATGAAAAALAAYLHDLRVMGAESIEVVQGEDMGVPCLIIAEAPSKRGGAAVVRGSARFLSSTE